MTQSGKLLLIKTIHAVVWLFYNAVMFYLLFAVIIGKIDKWVWIGPGSFLLEGIILLLFRNMCPLTIIAGKYAGSTKDNFDIFLPNWLARYNKLIYSILPGFVIILLIYRLLFS
jgi:hypothetical protein